MKTYIEFKDGTDEIIKDAAPSINVDDMTVYCINCDSVVVSDTYSLKDVRQIVFKP